MLVEERECLQIASNATLWIYWPSWVPGAGPAFRADGKHVALETVRRLRRRGFLTRLPQTLCTVEGVDITGKGRRALADNIGVQGELL